MGEYDDLIAYEKPAEEPGFFDRVGNSIAGLGRTVAAGAGAVGETLSHPIDTARDPSKRRELLRGLDNMVTLGYGQRLADRIGRALGDEPEVQLAATAPSDREAAPGFREAGMIGGAFTPGAANAIAKGGGQLVKLGTSGVKAASLPAALALGAVRGVGGYEATAPVTAALSADAAGDRLGAAREAATDPAGLLLSGGLGAAGGGVSRASETAPARVLERAKRDITTGEQNAAKKVTNKVSERAGEDSERLGELFGRDPELYKAIGIKAGTAPAKAAMAAEKSIARVGDRLDQIYETMAKADRLVTPEEIRASYDRMVGQRLAEGDIDAVNILRRARANFADEYSNYGKLSPETLRGLKATASRAAFAGDPTAPASLKAKISRDIWGVFSDAIEQQAKGTPGVDVGELRQLNQDMSVLMPIQQALDERAAAAGAGRFSIKHLIHGPAGQLGTAAAGALAGHEVGHPIAGAVAGLVGPPAARAAGQGVRAADFELARRFQGAAPDLSSGVGGRAAELAYAAKVAEGMGNGLSLTEAVEAAHHAKQAEAK